MQTKQATPFAKEDNIRSVLHWSKSVCLLWVHLCSLIDSFLQMHYYWAMLRASGHPTYTRLPGCITLPWNDVEESTLFWWPLRWKIWGLMFKEGRRESTKKKIAVQGCDRKGWNRLSWEGYRRSEEGQAGEKLSIISRQKCLFNRRKNNYYYIYEIFMRFHMQIMRWYFIYMIVYIRWDIERKIKTFWWIKTHWNYWFQFFFYNAHRLAIGRWIELDKLVRRNQWE